MLKRTGGTWYTAWFRRVNSRTMQAALAKEQQMEFNLSSGHGSYDMPEIPADNELHLMQGRKSQ